MRYLVFLIFLSFFVSEIRNSAVCVEQLDRDTTLRFFASDFLLEFRHSIHGGDVVLSCRVAGDKIVVESLESSNEASISYYTDLYKSTGGKFVAEVGEKMDAIVVNEGWKVKIQGEEFETKSLTRIFSCR